MNNLTDLINITKKATEIAEETEIFAFAVLKTDTDMKSLVSRLILLYDDLTDGYQNLPFGTSTDQLTQSSYELLDTLKTIVIRLLQRSDKTHNERAKLKSLDANIASLITELNSPVFATQALKISRRKETPIQSRRRSTSTLTHKTQIQAIIIE